MINNEDCVQLSEDCFNVCEALMTVTQPNSTGGLNESVKVALEDFERCAG